MAVYLYQVRAATWSKYAHPERHAEQRVDSLCVALLRSVTIQLSVISAATARVARYQMARRNDAARFAFPRPLPGTPPAAIPFAAPGIISTQACCHCDLRVSASLLGQPARRTSFSAV
ncbi:hypothetical protein OPT61_g8636 [Boeremia exigua]|uniref:Uncharacterized protein n=1 Tax=Boeremia exigua TaxID=749465 RepID=A0ACC2HXH5_9PLEO|nr:hypothetical protein OPT61_g8636 [Boeremia exigua]